MPIESHGKAWRVRIRWRGLLNLSVSVAEERDAEELEHALRQLKEANRRDLLAAVEQNVELLSDVVLRLRTMKPQALTLDALLKAQQNAPKTLGSAIKAWRSWTTTGGENRRRTAYSESTLAYYDLAIKAFVEFLPTGETTPIEQITPAILNTWRKDLTAKKKTTATVNRYIAAIQAIWSWMADPSKGNYPGVLPMRLPALIEKKSTARAKTKEQIEAVIAEVSPAKWRGPLILLMETGMRDSEMRFLRWSDVDLTERVITVRSHKERRLKTESATRRIPLTDAAKAVLKALPHQEGYLFPELTENRYTLAQAWKRANAKAKTKIRIHDLRHSYAVRVLSGGVDVASARDTLGHASISTTDRYAREVQGKEKLDRVRKALEVAPKLPQSSVSSAAETA